MGWQDLILRQAYLTEGNREFATAIADQGIVLYNKNKRRFSAYVKNLYG